MSIYSFPLILLFFTLFLPPLLTLLALLISRKSLFKVNVFFLFDSSGKWCCGCCNQKLLRTQNTAFPCSNSLWFCATLFIVAFALPLAEICLYKFPLYPKKYFSGFLWPILQRLILFQPYSTSFNSPPKGDPTFFIDCGFSNNLW